MIWRTLGLLNRFQKTLQFKVIATILIAMGSVTAFLLLLYQWRNHADDLQHIAEFNLGLREENYGILTRLLHTPDLEVEAAATIGIVAAAMAFLTWLGLGASVFGLLAFSAFIAFPLTFFEATSDTGQLLIGVVPLAFLFMTLLELVRRALSLPNPLFAIAKNVLAEAVRMKIGLVFIVALIFFLVLIPNMLSEDQPLRYRVQQWLQWGTGITGVIAGLLTIFFGCATVAFEQRDKVIWQTLTKPVAAWQYVIGKWLGVMSLNLVLLSVMAGGVFMFTEYLRLQPAEEEIAPYIVEAAFQDEQGRTIYSVVDTRRPQFRNSMTTDRRILEQQVLVAREGILPVNLDFSTDFWQERIRRAVQAEIEREQLLDPDLQITREYREQKAVEILKVIEAAARTTVPGRPIVFQFSGIANLAGTNDEVTLRYKINAGSNDPSKVYSFLFSIPRPDQARQGQGRNPPYSFVKQASLGVTQTLSIPTGLIPTRGENAGTLTISVMSGPENDRPATFPSGDVELMVDRGSYQLNFARIVLVMWIKLAFVAAVAVAASTVVSFPVAILVTLGFWFAAESSAFLYETLDWIAREDHEGNIIWTNLISTSITGVISWLLKTYGELRPDQRLVEGRIITWASLGWSIIVVGAWSVIAILVGIFSLRKREMALYSGR